MTEGPRIQRKKGPRRNDAIPPQHVYLWELQARLLAIVFDLQNTDVQNEAHGCFFIPMFSYGVSATSFVLILDRTLQRPALSSRNPQYVGSETVYRSAKEVSHLSSKLLFFLRTLFQLPVLLSEKCKVAQLFKVGVLLAVAVTFSLSKERDVSHTR